MIVHLPVHRVSVIDADTLQQGVAQTADSIMVDTLSNMIAQEPAVTDTIPNDTTTMSDKIDLLPYDMAERFPDKPATGPHKERRWSLELAYAGQFDEQNRYNQPFSYKPAPSDVQSLPTGQVPTVPSSIDNWTDYAVYLANNPDVVSAQTRSVIMRIP